MENIATKAPAGLEVTTHWLPAQTAASDARLPSPLHERERMLPFLICPKIGMPRRPNASLPKPVAKPFSCPSTLPKEKVKQFGSQTVFGRAAQPAEIAPIFVFLASDQASYVTGEIYGATGGQMPI